MEPARDPRRLGSAFLEFTLAAVPLIFTIVSLVWMCIGMWEYHTLAEAVNETTRYAAVHGSDCVGQTCATTLNQIATTLAARASGIPAHQISVTLTSTAQSYSSALLDSYYGNGTAWPSLAGNVAATTDISITATYQLSSPISMWIPGIGSYQFAAITLGATSKQPIIY
jgi:Flp pilus assembly protein TadG